MGTTGRAMFLSWQMEMGSRAPEKEFLEEPRKFKTWWVKDIKL